MALSVKNTLKPPLYGLNVEIYILSVCSISWLHELPSRLKRKTRNSSSSGAVSPDGKRIYNEIFAKKSRQALTYDYLIKQKMNFYELGKSIKRDKLRIWRWRVLTIIGRIQIVKTFTIPIFLSPARMFCLDKAFSEQGQ